MTSELSAVEESVRSQVDRYAPAMDDGRQVEFGGELWSDLDAGGYTTLSVTEELNGSGGDLYQAAAVVRGSAMAPGPYVESLLLAGPLLNYAQLPWPGGVVTAAGSVAARGVSVSEKNRLTGHLDRVAWMQVVDHVIVVVARAEALAVAIIAADAPGFSVLSGSNAAGEQRADARLEDVEPVAIAWLPDGDWAQRCESLGAVGRSLQISSIARQVVDLTIAHVRTRTQFGRTLAEFQVVQHRVAEMATQVSAGTAAVDAAVRALQDDDEDAAFLSAAAKMAAAETVRVVVPGAHQLHGAIGTTAEHRLGLLTTRLWAWREEFGNEQIWTERIAEMLASSDYDVWDLITGGSYQPTEIRR